MGQCSTLFVDWVHVENGCVISPPPKKNYGESMAVQIIFLASKLWVELDKLSIEHNYNLLLVKVSCSGLVMRGVNSLIVCSKDSRISPSNDKYYEI